MRFFAPDVIKKRWTVLLLRNFKYTSVFWSTTRWLHEDDLNVDECTSRFKCCISNERKRRVKHDDAWTCEVSGEHMWRLDIVRGRAGGSKSHTYTRTRWAHTRMPTRNAILAGEQASEQTNERECGNLAVRQFVRHPNDRPCREDFAPPEFPDFVRSARAPAKLHTIENPRGTENHINRVAPGEHSCRLEVRGRGSN